MAWELVKLESKKISNENLNELYGIVENLMGILMEMQQKDLLSQDFLVMQNQVKKLILKRILLWE